MFLFTAANLSILVSIHTGSLFIFTAPNINITVLKRPADRIAEEPILCETSGVPAVVTLPDDVLSGTTANLSELIYIVMYVLGEGGEIRSITSQSHRNHIVITSQSHRTRRSRLTL